MAKNAVAEGMGTAFGAMTGCAMAVVFMLFAACCLVAGCMYVVHNAVETKDRITQEAADGR